MGEDSGRSEDSVRSEDAREDGTARIEVDGEGGEAACWLQRVCPDCGALNEGPDDDCWRCGLSLSAQRE